MKKRVIAFLLCLLLLCSFVACQSSADPDNTQTPDQTPQETTPGDPSDPKKDAVQNYVYQLMNAYEADLYPSYYASTAFNDTQVSEEEARNANLNLISEDPNYTISYVKRQAKYSLDDLCYWGSNNQMIFPGALLKMQVDGKGDALSGIVGVSRAPLVLSSDASTAYGIEYVSPEVTKITYSQINAAVNGIVKGLLTKTAELPMITSMDLTRVQSEEEVSAALGLGFDCPFMNIKNVFNFSEGNDKTYAILRIKQVYYTIVADYDYQKGVYSIIGEDTSLDSLQRGCPDGYCPVYVSSVSYGRTVAIAMDITDSYTALQERFNMDVNAGCIDFDMNAALDYLQSFENENWSYFIYGGAASSQQGALTARNIQEVKAALNAPYDPTKVIGVPISYRLSHVYDNSPAKVGFANEYYVPVYTRSPIAPTETTDFAGGKGTAQSPFIIRTPEQFMCINRYPDAYYRLDNDLDMSGFDFAPILAFNGTFDGRNHTIRNIRYAKTTYNSEILVGVFARNAGVIRNLKLENCTFTVIPVFTNTGCDIMCGALVGYNTDKGEISQCSLSGCSVTASSSNVAEQFREIYDTDPRTLHRGDPLWQTWITQSFARSAHKWANMVYRVHTGGVVGYNAGTVGDVRFYTGKVESNLFAMQCRENSKVVQFCVTGGIAGYNCGTVERVDVTADVSAWIELVDSAGGMGWVAETSPYANCYLGGVAGASTGELFVDQDKVVCTYCSNENYRLYAPQYAFLRGANYNTGTKMRKHHFVYAIAPVCTVLK